MPAMLFCLGWWLTRRDWRAGAALLGVAAGWVTWLPFVSRTKFYYYALEFEPFLIICIVLCLGLILGSASSRLHRAIGSIVVALYVLAVLVVFWYFYPILSGKIIPYSDWLSHMWYQRLDLASDLRCLACLLAYERFFRVDTACSRRRDIS